MKGNRAEVTVSASLEEPEKEWVSLVKGNRAEVTVSASLGEPEE